MPRLLVDPQQPGAQQYTVPITAAITHLGRAEDNTVSLAIEGVSRHHAKILRRGDQVVVMDLNSLNGTYVNNQRIVERVLSDRDEIRLGGNCLLVYLADDPGQAPKPDSSSPSSLVQDLAKIRDEMDRVSSTLTMIGKQATSGQPQAQAVAQETAKQDVLTMSRAFRRLSALYQASKLLASDFDISKRLSAVLDTAMEVTGADRGFLMVREEATGALRVSVAREMGQDMRAGSPSMSIAGRAAMSGEPVLMTSDDQQYSGSESIIRQQIRSAMCVPLRIEDRLLGSIYVDTRSTTHTFNQEDLELFASVAAQAAFAIDNVRLYQRMVETEKKRANLGRFLSPSIVEEIMRKEGALELGGTKRVVTAFFCDIRGFTPIAERLPASTLVDMLNEHFTAMTQIIFSMQGTLDKYIGDEIMAVFGSPLNRDDDALRAVTAAVTMQIRNHEMNTKRQQAGLPPFELGIGVATGEVIAGLVGSPDRMEFTVVGDRVNTARRLCSLAEPGQVVVADTTYELIKDHVKARAIGTVLLKGKEEPVHAYEVEAIQ
ncbi:MAG: GAF domain-containing protein [Candidatus Hydrogenedentes bacterium]|nr:GAF domain-containing protein [Candidatus Hydrogenedentota bacterium]